MVIGHDVHGASSLVHMKGTELVKTDNEPLDIGERKPL
jgi:hypothetical protein